MDLTLYIHKLLEPLNIEVLFLVRAEKQPSISFHLFGETGKLYGDGDARIMSGSLQIDLFTKKSSEIRPFRKKIIELISESKDVVFLKSTPDESSYEPDDKLYHQVIVFEFSYLEESELI